MTDYLEWHDRCESILPFECDGLTDEQVIARSQGIVNGVMKRATEAIAIRRGATDLKFGSPFVVRNAKYPCNPTLVTYICVITTGKVPKP